MLHTSPLRLAALALMVLALVIPLEAEASRLPSLSSLFSPDTAAKLRSDGSLVLTAPAGQGASLLPNHQGVLPFSTALAAEKPSLLVESVYLYKRPLPQDSQRELKTLYGTLLAISSLEGTQYWSASRKTMRTFYAESYRIDGPDTRKRLPDATPPATGPLEASAQYYSFQKDLTFGPNVYSCAYKTYPDAVSLESINLTSLTYMGIPVMSPKGLRIRLITIQAEEGIVFYVVNSADVPRLPIIRDKVEESITNRADALFKWFVGRQK